MYQFKPNAKRILEREGIEQTELADAAGYSMFNLNKRLNQGGHIRPVNANRIARAFANLAKTSHDRALSMLFDEVDLTSEN